MCEYLLIILCATLSCIYILRDSINWIILTMKSIQCKLQYRFLIHQGPPSRLHVHSNMYRHIGLSGGY